MTGPLPPELAEKVAEIVKKYFIHSDMNSYMCLRVILDAVPLIVEFVWRRDAEICRDEEDILGIGEDFAELIEREWGKP